ncbi:hypothetical protein E2562_031243 [Oryza meyeriana var. granulata]|uniref:Uncharacterized protein n=1 Tax=Oryza meyeriana var. granulata TaxID=110450 RepID=A0A6G1DSU8_9ORYZ|nr:hypothetical protein E2562_031243 [Oryza meyeriana var. granulata]
MKLPGHTSDGGADGEARWCQRRARPVSETNGNLYPERLAAEEEQGSLGSDFIGEEAAGGVKVGLGVVQSRWGQLYSGGDGVDWFHVWMRWIKRLVLNCESRKASWWSRARPVRVGERGREMGVTGGPCWWDSRTKEGEGGNKGQQRPSKLCRDVSRERIRRDVEQQFRRLAVHTA